VLRHDFRVPEPWRSRSWYSVAVLAAGTLRVAVVQLDFDPIASRWPTPCARDPIDWLVPPSVGTSPRIVELADGLRAVYLEQLHLRVTAIFAACQRVNAGVVVFPAHSLPAALLSRFSPRGWVVAGCIFADQAALRALHATSDPDRLHDELVVPLLGGFLGHDIQPRLHGASEPWRPFANTDGLGVLLGSDIQDRELWAARVVPGLDACTRLVVLDDTRPGEQPDLLAALVDQPPLRPLLFACATAIGGSDVLAADAPDPPPGALAVSALAPGEEGLRVYELTPGPAPTRRLVSAASFVYRVEPVAAAYADWSHGFITQGSDWGMRLEDRSVRSAIATIDDARPVLLAARGLADAPTRQRRLDHLLAHLHRITRPQVIGALTHEVVLPPECLPLPDLHAVLIWAASKRVEAWHRLGPTGEASALAEHLRARRPDEAAFDRWSAHGQKARRDLHAQIVDVWTTPAAAPPEVRGDDVLTPTRRWFGDLGVALVARTSDLDPDPRTTAEHLRELDEAMDWLALSGATDRRILAVFERDQTPAPPAILGRLDGAINLWTLDPLVDRDVRLRAIEGLKLHVPRQRHVRLDLEAHRTRLPELLRPYADVVRGLAGERNHRLGDVEGVYGPQHATRDGDDAPRAALDTLDEWVASSDRLALLLGAGGVGKTTLLHEWAGRRLAAGSGPLPLPVRLTTSAAVDPRALILRRAGRRDNPHERAALAVLLANDRLVPCFDELDGVPEPGRRDALTRALRDLADHARVLVATRPFRAPEGQGLDLLRGRSASVRALHLEPFTPEQVAALVTRVHAEIGDARDVLRRIAGIYELADLVRQPLLLGMVLQTLDRLDPSAYLDGADIHDAYLRNWLATTPGASASFVEAIALTLWHADVRTCTLADLRRAPWRDLVGAPPGDAPFFLADGDTYYFAHQSFFEFFLARALAEHLPAHPVELLSVGFPGSVVVAFMTSHLRRTASDPPRSRLVVALQDWLTAGPALDRKRHSACAGSAALYLHTLGRGLDPTRQWVPPGADLVDAVLSRQDLAGARLVDVELAGADLSHADLRGADLRRASLGNAHLNAAVLDGTDLRGADARRAWFSGVEADRCDLRGADLRGAHLDGSNWSECRWDDARLDPHGNRWLNLGGSGTALGHGLPRTWRLAIDSGRPHMTRLAWSPDGRRLAFEMLGRAGVLDVGSGAVQFHEGPLRALGWAPDGRLAVIDRDGAVHLGTPDDPPARTRLPTPGPAFDLAWRPGDDALVLATWRGVEVEQDGRWTPIHRLAIPRDERMPPRLHASPRGPIVVRDFAGAIHLHATLADSPRRLRRSTYASHDLALAPTGEFLAADDLMALEIHDLRGPASEPRKQDDRATAFAWKPGTNLLTYTRESGVLVTYDAALGRAVDEAWLHPTVDASTAWTTSVNALAWSPAGDRLALIANNARLQICDPGGHTRFELLVAADAHALWVDSGWCAFSDPLHRDFSIRAFAGPDHYSYPLAGLRRVLHRPELVAHTLAGDAVPTAEAALDALGWHAPPTAAGSPGSRRPALAPNRFRPGAPLRDPDLPGRDDTLRALTSLLDGLSPAVLKGPRRAGKTSILHALEARLRGPRLVLRRTLEGQPPRTPDDLAVLLDPALRGQPEPALALRTRLAAEPRPAIVLLDELAWLGGADDRLFAWLRVLGQEGVAGLVLSGSHSDWVDLVRKASRIPGSSFGNDYTIVELGPLSDERALEFLATTAPDDVPIDPQRTGRWILDLCGGWPFYLQVMGHAVVEEARSDRRGPLADKTALIDLYERKLLDDHAAVFTNRWSDLRRPAQQVLLELFREARRARHNELTPHRELTRSARAALRDADLLDPNRGYKIDRPLRDWLHRNLDDLELHDA